MQLTTNFSLAEMIKSSKALELGIQNIPSEAEIVNLTLLCKAILQPLRNYYHAPVDMQSGFRCRLLNKVVGGSEDSDHIRGMAADIEIAGISNLELARYIIKFFKFTQVILEFHREEIPNSGWIHVSYNPADLRCQVLTAVKRGGKTVYLPGLVPQ